MLKSELSRLNQQPVNEWIKVSGELFYVLKTAKDIYQQTHGYYIDISGFFNLLVSAISEH
jgi:thiamine biosynthesis lipoprotein ApbE